MLKTISTFSIIYDFLCASYMVVNGACKDKDMLHFAKYQNNYEDLLMSYDSSRQLLALQVNQNAFSCHIVPSV